MLAKIVAAYNEAIYDTDRQRAHEVVDEALAQGVTPEQIVFEVVIPAIELMMKSISERHGASLAQHFLTAQIASEVVTAMLPRFKQVPAPIGRVVLGTAAGDLHSLGRRIVSGCLKAMMIDVVDLGVNVPPERFVDEAVAQNAQVIGISAMMMHTARGENGALKVRRILRERGLEDRIKIAVGGAPYRFDPELYRAVGADGWAADGVTAGKIIADLIKETRR